jgi:replicative DNA helicase
VSLVRARVLKNWFAPRIPHVRTHTYIYPKGYTHGRVIRARHDQTGGLFTFPQEGEAQLDFEKALITAIVERKDFRSVQKRKIDATYFENSQCRALFSWLAKWYNDPKKTDTPSWNYFSDSFPAFERVVSEDSMDAICEKVRERVEYSDISDTLQDVAKRTASDPKDGLKALREHVSRLAAKHTVSDASDLRSHIDELREEYLRMKSLDGAEKLKGRPYPWDAANLATMGAQNGHLIWFYGRPKAKKTWILLKTIQGFYEAGAIPLICSQELTDIEIARRMVAIDCQVDYGKYVRGELDPLTEKRFLLRLEEFVERPPCIITSLTSMGEDAPAELSALIEEHGATVAAIDAANCLGNDVKEIVGMTRGFKRVAKQRDIPIVGTTQRLRQKGKKAQSYGSENGDDVYGSDSYLQDCDAMWLVESDLEMRKAGEVQLTSVALRDGRPVKFIIEARLCTNFAQKRVVPFDDEDEDASETIQALDGQDDTRADEEPVEEESDEKRRARTGLAKHFAETTRPVAILGKPKPRAVLRS